MIPVINDIDRLLQAAPSRYGEAYARSVQLSASDRAFEVALDATVSPSAIVFIASRTGFTGGTVVFTTDNGTPLSVDGDVATLVPAALMGSGCEVLVTITYQGEPHVARQSVTKQLAFDSSVPPAPSGLATIGTLASIQLSWNPTNNANIGAVEVWRALTNDLAAAAAVGSTAGLARTFVDGIGAGGSFFYWIRYVSKANVVGPFNAAPGTLGTAGTDAEYLLELLQNEITQSQLHDDLGKKIDLITDAATTVGSVAQRIALEAAARAEAVLAEANARAQALAAEASARESGISSEASTRQEADGVLSSRIDTVVSNVAGNAAAIVSEQTTRANADGALGTRIDSVVATASGNTAAILAEQSARADADGALSSRIDTVVASSGAANAAVVEERNARVSADGALATRIDSVVATAAGNAAAILAEQSARADADGALSSRIDTIVASSGGANAAVVEERNARVSADGALSSRIDTVVASASGNTAAIASEAQTRANADGALASAIDTLFSASGQNAAAIQSEANTRASQTGANAQQIATVQATVSDPSTGLVAKYAAVKTQADATVNAVGAVQAKYGVQVEADGVAGGYELLGGGGRVDFGVRANTFFVAAPAGAGIPAQVPFVVRTTWTTVGGHTYAPGLYVDSAWIYNLHAERLQAGTVTADKMGVNELSAISANLGTMTAARIQSAASGQRVVTTEKGVVMFDQFNNRRVQLGDDSL